MKLIKEKNYSKDMELTVKPYLDKRKTEGYFEGYDKNRLRYFYYRADKEIGAIVICHGFTESCEKYDELSYYFLCGGYSVFIPEHRGHGLSYRKVKDNTLTHIDSFSEYVKDFKIFINTFVKKNCNKPLYLYAHSMGGAIGMLYMLKNRKTFKKAFLTAPMIAPKTGKTPYIPGLIILNVLTLLGKGESPVLFSKEYPGYEKFETSCDTSRARFDYYEQKRETTPYLQNFNPTNKWALEAMKVTGKILRNRNLKRLTLPLYLFSAEKDTMVKNKPQKKLTDKMDSSMFISVSDSKHEIYMSKDDVMEKYLDCIFTFLKN